MCLSTASDRRHSGTKYLGRPTFAFGFARPGHCSLSLRWVQLWVTPRILRHRKSPFSLSEYTASSTFCKPSFFGLPSSIQGKAIKAIAPTMMVLAAYYMLGINALSFVMHAEDKLSASGWLPLLGRIPEAFLHQVELAGGSPGSFAAQRVFKHKISKTRYQRGFSQVLVVQMALGLAWGGFLGPSWILGAAELAAALMLAGTTKRVRHLERWKQGNGKQQWQRPVSTAPLQQRRRTRS